jgi:hypothetical protein
VLIEARQLIGNFVEISINFMCGLREYVLGIVGVVDFG